MNRRSFLPSFVICFLGFTLIASPAYAYAYADPNTVGMLSQILTPLLIIVGASVTFLRQRIAALFAGVTRRLRRRADA
jgi:hypothetical protein